MLRGSKQEIAADLARIQGDVREAIVFEEEPAPTPDGTRNGDSKDIFDEMRSFMVNVPDFDDSREAIYSRVDGE